MEDAIDKFWKAYWRSLPETKKLSVRATNVIINSDTFVNGVYLPTPAIISTFKTGKRFAMHTREQIIDEVKSKRLLKHRNCGPKTFNEIAAAFGLKNYRHIKKPQKERILVDALRALQDEARKTDDDPGFVWFEYVNKICSDALKQYATK